MAKSFRFTRGADTGKIYGARFANGSEYFHVDNLPAFISAVAIAQQELSLLGAKEFASRMKGVIEDQEAEGIWQNLKSTTVDRKGHNKMLIETRALVDNIEVQRVGIGHVAGWSDTQTHPNSNGKSLGYIARIHEEGIGVVPRPPIATTDAIYGQGLAQSMNLAVASLIASGVKDIRPFLARAAQRGGL